MIQNKDVFAPCLKLKNKVVIHKDKKIAEILQQSETFSTDTKLREVVLSKLKEECNLKKLPNFTCQADFGIKTSVGRIYSENSKIVKAKYEQKWKFPNSFVIQDTESL